MALHERHQQVLVSGCVNIHEQLAEMQASLAEGANPSTFSRFYNDLSPAEIQAIHDQFARLRSIMQDWLAQHEIPVEIRRTGLRWATQCGVNFVNISVAEMGAGKLIGYGELDDRTRDEVVRLQSDLQGALAHVADLLREKAISH